VSCYDDLGFLTRVLDAVESEFNTDPTRYYLLGVSNGAQMALRLGCSMPERFAAVAAIAARMPPGFECTPPNSLPLLHLYGEKDDVAGNNGRPTSDGWIYSSAAETAAIWAGGMGCTSGFRPWHSPVADTHGLQCSAYTDCATSGHQVVACMDPKIGHEWSGQRLSHIPANCVSPEQQASFPDQPPCPEAGDEPAGWGMTLVWNFLSKYRRAPAP